MSLFKYFKEKKFLESFISSGAIRFHSISYFTTCEDVLRKDVMEDINAYSPSGGLDGRKVIGNLKIDLPSTLVSRIKNPQRTFIFCASEALKPDLYKRFQATGCVEITEIEEFKNRILKKLIIPMKFIKNKSLLAGKVDYYDLDKEPGSRHACPDQIIMSKPMNFSIEEEYRFAFALDQNAFAVNNVDYILVNKIVAGSHKPAYQDVLLGDLSDICRIIS